MRSSIDNQPTALRSVPERSLKVLQLTDSHLYADPSRCLLGINTLETFDQVLAQALHEQGTPDLLLATGDLVHDASDTGYKRLLGRLKLTGIPTYCLPGNHDLPHKMRQVLNQDNVHTLPSVQANGWSLIFLDSTIPGNESGNLDKKQMEMLQLLLEAHTDKHTLICMHHHPLPVGSRWMDTMTLKNPDQFFNLVGQHPQVKAVLCGHIHQEFQGEHNGVKLLGTPSTCVQFIAGQDDFGIDACPPGYRWLTLQQNGEIETGLGLLPEIPSGLDLASMGY
ncbi:MAG: 3',5'-cyclic-AMP phosphodiesterase [Candidatus Thiodiazotropha sp. (ex Semelilucina semeliformis)]|nr:3',5'-cyclic-AMP phosphodiesterase [Candidatus Thiodiazotropha sp. (ex Semelilucina semeliformis)]MCU7828061.1 3',5'-cyclic-AMP phosphodiesterase [Candidatus Thiodiazotropha sp. (ex Myrtea sp. 'scaly one' KF741663)]